MIDKMYTSILQQEKCLIKLNRESNATTMMYGNKASFVERISTIMWFKVTKINRS